MNILGISAYYHDSAACITIDEKIVAAAQEERFTRKKHDASFPINAIEFCLKDSNLTPEEIDYVVFYEKPFLKFERIIETYLAFAPKGFRSFLFSMPIWLKNKLFQKREITKNLESHVSKNVDWSTRLLFSQHHLSHSASAFFPSPFNEAAILTMDGVGEWATTSFSIGKGNNIAQIEEIHFPHSIGLLYSAFTYYIGFRVNSGEYKLMGLAPYGKPKYVSKIKDNLINIKDDGSFQLDISYFDFCTGLTMTNNKFHKLFGGPPKKPDSALTQKQMDLASSIQKVTEEVVIKMAKSIKSKSGLNNLCLAGGVALNSVVNGILMRENIFKKIWIQPASGDAGGAIGAALLAYYVFSDNKREPDEANDSMRGCYLGPKYNTTESKAALKKLGAKFIELSDDEIIEHTANSIKEGKAIGWMDGRMEFGPRALGNRSIIADARSPIMQSTLNLKIKYRESFRPFAPSVLLEYCSEWFELNEESPYMLLVTDIRDDKKLINQNGDNKLDFREIINLKRSSVPAITHIDYSARIQTVDGKYNPRYHKLISRFNELTNCPIIVNTSFNIRGEPIVCSPSDAFKCFMGTELDNLVIGNLLLVKSDQNIELLNDYKNLYGKD